MSGGSHGSQKPPVFIYNNSFYFCVSPLYFDATSGKWSSGIISKYWLTLKPMDISITEITQKITHNRVWTEPSGVLLDAKNPINNPLICKLILIFTPQWCHAISVCSRSLNRVRRASEMAQSLGAWRTMTTWPSPTGQAWSSARLGWVSDGRWIAPSFLISWILNCHSRRPTRTGYIRWRSNAARCTRMSRQCSSSCRRSTWTAWTRRQALSKID